VQDQSEALDVAQETFIKAYKALDSFRGESAFYTWLYRIATNTAKNYLVTRNRRPPGTDIDIDDVLQAESESELRDIETPENNLYRDELFGVMASALEALPEELRVALTLRELEGMSYEDIAEVMGCPIGTVRSRIFRARDAIDKELKPLLSS
jgi:RNA polymerase sigma-70 factor (ECF subfamily)